MKTIHELSSVTPHPEYDLFVLPPTQLTVEKNIQTEHRPISVVTDSRSVIQFELNSALDEYIQLRDTLIKIKLKINIKRSDNDDVTEMDWKKICPVNYFLHSLFSNVQVEIGGKPIMITPHTYPYKAYFDATLGYTRDARNSYLSAAMYFNDIESKSEFTEQQSFN
jgi:hypothetical protein